MLQARSHLSFLVDDFKDGDHPRDEDGKFASGSSSNSKNKNKKKEQITASVAFGNAYTDYSGKPKEAIDKLLSEKQGHVPAAIYKEGIGDIDFVYGNDDYGLAHIIKRRNSEGLDGEAFVKELPEIIEKGKVDIKDKVFGRIYIDNNSQRASVRLDWNNEDKNWLVTAYNIKDK